MNALERLLTKHIFKRITGRDDLHLIFANIGWQSFDQLFRMGVGLLVGFRVTKYLGPEQNGIFYLVITLSMLIAPIANAGIDAILSRDLANKNENKGKLLGTALIMKMLYSIASYTALSIYAYFSYGNTPLIFTAILIVSLNLFSNNIILIFDQYFQSIIKSKYTVYAKTTVFAIFVILKLYFVFIQAPLLWFVSLFVLESVASAIGVGVLYLFQTNRTSHWSFDIEVFKSYFTNGYLLIFQGLLLGIQSYIDQVMLAEFINFKELGWYSVAYRFVTVFSFLSISICGSLTTTLAQAKINSTELFHKKMQNLYRTMFLLFAFIFILITASNGIIIDMFLGEKFEPCKHLILLMAGRLFFTHFGLARSQYITNTNQFSFLMITTLTGTISSIALNYALIPILGVNGAIVSFYVSYFISTFAIDIFHPTMRTNLQLMVNGCMFWKK
ncbi:MAG: flippase [Bacteroidota bacterium]|nr:flippase [Bacteroidota bacterium]